MKGQSKFARQFGPLYAVWRDDILAFARDGLNVDVTSQQRELLEIVQLESKLPLDKRKKRIAVKSGQGPGKTKVSVIIALWRCLRYPDALCIVTSPSMRQCKQWVDECKRVVRDAHIVIQKYVKCYGTKVEINGTDIWAIKTATASRPENLQGIHEERLTFIGDEASGIAPAIIETIQGTLSNPDALFLMIGNPNHTSCKFFDCFTSQRDLWWTLTFNAEDTARDYPHIVDPARNRALEKEYGRNSDVYRVRVLGEFPQQDPNGVMGIEDLMVCTRTNKLGCSTILNILDINKAIGIDYARYGGDESVVVRRTGLAVTDYEVFVKRDPREVTDFAFRLQYDANWKTKDTWYIPDAGGMGQGIVHSFYEAGKNVKEFHTSGVAHDSEMFANAYSEAWWVLRSLVREHICHLPNDARLLKQLSTRQYYVDMKGRVKVESKDEWRKRMEIDESPDRADAIVMAFYPHLGQGVKMASKEKSQKTVGTRLKNTRRRR